MMFSSTRSSQEFGSTTTAMGTTPQPLSHNSLKDSARKAVRASKSFVGKVTAKVSPVVLHKPSHGDLDTALHHPSDTSFISSASSTSTAPTALSLPVPDCGAQFKVPGFEIINDIIASDFMVSLGIEPGPNIEQRNNTQGHDTDVGRSAELDHKIRPASRADSALELRSTLATDSADGEVRQSTKTSKMAKLRQWGKIMKVQLVKLARSKSTKIEDKDTGEDATPTSDVETTIGDDVDEEEEDEYDEDEDEEDEEDDDYPRCEFKTIEAISDEKFQDLVQSHCGSTYAKEQIVVVKRTRGSWHFAAIINIAQDGSTVKEYVVRIPGHGTLDHWTPQDAYMVEREAQLINLIRNKTTAPVPEIIGFETSHDHAFGYPYIMMVKLPGKIAGSIWFDQPYENSYAYRTSDVPSTSTEKKRINFLRSLAHHMTAIQALSFDKIGMVVTSDVDAPPTIAPHFHWKNDGSDLPVKRDTAASTLSYILDAIAIKFKQNKDRPIDAEFTKAYGNRLFFNIVFKQPVFVPPKPETFTIHHNDLDLQNILVDDEGNVTGIIDWDASHTAPRCIGAAAVPVFLRNDWFPRYAHDIRLTPHMAWNYQHYREVYAAAMFEAGNPDAQYTLSSALYQSVFGAIMESGDRYDLVAKILREIPDCRVDATDFQLALGLGWPAALDFLAAQLPKVFEPKLPRPDLLAQLDVDIALKEWWLTFDTYLEEDDEDTDLVSEDESKVSEADEDDDGESNTEAATQCD